MKGTIQEHIEIREGYDGKVPFIVGHRIRVQDVVIWHEEMRMSPYEIIYKYPTVTLADVYAALAYYHDNVGEIELALAEDQAFYERAKREQEEIEEEQKQHRNAS